MDITKIEQARELFSAYEQVNHFHDLAIEEFLALQEKHFNFQILDKKKLRNAIRTVLNRHFETLKQEFKVKISEL